jgi:hypothetical protein
MPICITTLAASPTFSVSCCVSLCSSLAVSAHAASIRFLMNTSACRTSATWPTAIVQPPTVVSTVVQKAITGPVTGAAVPKDRMVMAVMMAMITPASAVIEPRMTVSPVAISAADFNRLPSGSRCHCAAENRLAPPESIIPGR